MTNPPIHRWRQFRISTILLLMVILGLGISWQRDRRQHDEELQQMVFELHKHQMQIIGLERERAKLRWALRDMARQLEDLKAENEQKTPRRFPLEQLEDGDQSI